MKVELSQEREGHKSAPNEHVSQLILGATGVRLEERSTALGEMAPPIVEACATERFAQLLRESPLVLLPGALLLQFLRNDVEIVLVHDGRGQRDGRSRAILSLVPPVGGVKHNLKREKTGAAGERQMGEKRR